MSITFQKKGQGVFYLKVGERDYYYLEEEKGFRIQEKENGKILQEKTFEDGSVGYPAKSRIHSRIAG